MGKLSDRIVGLGQSDAEREAALLQESSRNQGAATIGSCRCGEIVTVCGSLRSVTLDPTNALATVQAELYDGSGRIVLVWLGRREIPGIEPGRVLSATGRLTSCDGTPTIFNPRYRLLASVASD